MYLVSFITLIVCLFGITNSIALKQEKKTNEIIKTERMKTFDDKSLNIENARTKLDMMKNFIASVLDQLNIPNKTINDSFNVPVGNLTACMTLFKDIARDSQTGKDLIKLEKLLKITGLKERLDDTANVERAVKFIKAYVSPRDLSS